MQTSTTSRRTWKATAYVMLDRVIIEHRTYTITVERAGDTITSATVDGQPATIEHAAHLLVWAKATGTLQIVERFDVALLGKARAARLHRVLARLGLSSADHYRTATRPHCGQPGRPDRSGSQKSLELRPLAPTGLPAGRLNQGWAGCAHPSRLLLDFE